MRPVRLAFLHPLAADRTSEQVPVASVYGLCDRFHIPNRRQTDGEESLVIDADSPVDAGSVGRPGRVARVRRQREEVARTLREIADAVPGHF